MRGGEHRCEEVLSAYETAKDVDFEASRRIDGKAIDRATEVRFGGGSRGSVIAGLSASRTWTVIAK
jgi:hypothetical protein